MGTPGMAELARQARDGDADAAYMLACGCADRLSFPEFKDQIVPDGDLSPDLFDVLCDAYDKARAQADTIEIPIPGGKA